MPRDADEALAGQGFRHVVPQQDHPGGGRPRRRGCLPVVLILRCPRQAGPLWSPPGLPPITLLSCSTLTPATRHCRREEGVGGDERVADPAQDQGGPGRRRQGADRPRAPAHEPVRQHAKAKKGGLRISQASVPPLIVNIKPVDAAVILLIHAADCIPVAHGPPSLAAC